MHKVYCPELNYILSLQGFVTTFMLPSIFGMAWIKQVSVCMDKIGTGASLLHPSHAKKCRVNRPVFFYHNFSTLRSYTSSLVFKELQYNYMIVYFRLTTVISVKLPCNNFILWSPQIHRKSWKY